MSCVIRSAIDVEAATGSDSVVGKPRPEKDVRRTLTVGSDIAAALMWRGGK